MGTTDYNKIALKFSLLFNALSHPARLIQRDAQSCGRSRSSNIVCCRNRNRESVPRLSLTQLLDSAVQHNYLLQANEKNIAIKQAEIEILKTNYQPRISTSALQYAGNLYKIGKVSEVDVLKINVHITTLAHFNYPLKTFHYEKEKPKLTYHSNFSGVDNYCSS